MNTAAFWPSVADDTDRKHIIFTNAAWLHDSLPPRELDAAVAVLSGQATPVSDTTINAEVDVDNDAIRDEIVRQAMGRLYELKEFAQEENLSPPSATVIKEFADFVLAYPSYFSATTDRLPGIFLADSGGLELVFESQQSNRRSEITIQPDHGVELWTSDRTTKDLPYSPDVLQDFVSEGFGFVWGSTKG